MADISWDDLPMELTEEFRSLRKRVDGLEERIRDLEHAEEWRWEQEMGDDL